MNLDSNPAHILLIVLVVASIAGLLLLGAWGVRWIIATLKLQIYETEAKASAHLLEKRRNEGQVKSLEQSHDLQREQHMKELEAIRSQIDNIAGRITQSDLGPDLKLQLQSLYQAQERMTSEMQSSVRSLSGTGLHASPEVLDSIHTQLAAISQAVATIGNDRPSTVPLANLEATIQSLTGEILGVRESIAELVRGQANLADAVNEKGALHDEEAGGAEDDEDAPRPPSPEMLQAFEVLRVGLLELGTALRVQKEKRARSETALQTHVESTVAQTVSSVLSKATKNTQPANIIAESPNPVDNVQFDQTKSDQTSDHTTTLEGILAAAHATSAPPAPTRVEHPSVTSIHAQPEPASVPVPALTKAPVHSPSVESVQPHVHSTADDDFLRHSKPLPPADPSPLRQTPAPRPSSDLPPFGDDGQSAIQIPNPTAYSSDATDSTTIDPTAGQSPRIQGELKRMIEETQGEAPEATHARPRAGNGEHHAQTFPKADPEVETNEPIPSKFADLAQLAKGVNRAANSEVSDVF
jgi:hypothetical protein